ncbi:hypothetical protein [Chitinophaga sp. LS1]|uniref:hypothetical protein n=1 Tax=Chitinophaga sp. LS1 TaxID=3051176 RepID=UPI002AAA96CD|nr:hypothetical protein [Chitinophaga sp. LS1]WPV70599.1 hypothetical protein QQL36_17965 [Chitinophaga sp. LS1]
MATTLDFSEILAKMLEAAEGALSDKWPDIRDLAISSTKTLAQNIIDIEDLIISGVISKEQARLKLDIQKNAFKIMLLSEQGLGILAVEGALNAMLSVVKDVVNTAIGFILL